MTDKKKDRPFVFVRCMTFNHEAYIKDALNGFVMQQTTFPFVVAIINDASTDKTKSVINEFVENNCIHNPEIDLRIEEYGTVLDVIVKDNPHCIFHIVHLNENHYGKKSKLPYFAKYENAAKYVAMCEGDDYWTDPLKLQKQVDFMETNPEYGLCYAKAYRYNEELKKYIGVKGSARAEVYELSIQGTHHISTPTILMRQSLFLNCLSDSSFLMNNGLFTDSSIWWWFAANSKLYFMDDVVAVYRELPESASHSKDINIVKDRIRKALKVKLYFLLKYPIQNKVYLESVIEDYLLYVDNYAQYHGFVIGDKIRKSKRYLLGQKVYNFIKKIKLC